VPTETLVADVTPRDVAKPTDLMTMVDVSDASLDVPPDVARDVAHVPLDAPDVPTDCASTPMTPACDTATRRCVERPLRVAPSAMP
jgi:hypothetical protein